MSINVVDLVGLLGLPFFIISLNIFYSQTLVSVLLWDRLIKFFLKTFTIHPRETKVAQILHFLLQSISQALWPLVAFHLIFKSLATLTKRRYSLYTDWPLVLPAKWSRRFFLSVLNHGRNKIYELAPEIRKSAPWPLQLLHMTEILLR